MSEIKPTSEELSAEPCELAARAEAMKLRELEEIFGVVQSPPSTVESVAVDARTEFSRVTHGGLPHRLRIRPHECGIVLDD